MIRYPVLAIEGIEPFAAAIAVEYSPRRAD
jgi:hypothetical protein